MFSALQHHRIAGQKAISVQVGLLKEVVREKCVFLGQSTEKLKRSEENEEVI